LKNNDNILEVINKYGVAIIPNILNEEECNNVEYIRIIN
jgi:hypothetical protein